MNNAFTIHTDGGARGNPGPAAIGVVIEKNGTLLAEFGEKIGDTTNNVAEYTAVIKALQYLQSKGEQAEQITFILDSLLVVNQLMGTFKIKDTKLQILAAQVKSLERILCGKVIYTAVRRELNKRADFFVNQALDASN
ncbi:MAG: ribonuclease HI family protein [Microgenomates group bacterium]